MILCPQHLPKFHPHLDLSIKALLDQFPSSVLVVLASSKKQQWRNTLEARWMDVLGEGSTKERIFWMGSLNSEEYLTMLLMGDIMLDPYPFGGGVAILESLAVSTPIITIPTQQTVPALADGMVITMSQGSQAGIELAEEVAYMTVEYIDSLLASSKHIIESGHAYREVVSRTAWRLFDDDEVADHWGDFFSRAYKMTMTSIGHVV